MSVISFCDDERCPPDPSIRCRARAGWLAQEQQQHQSVLLDRNRAYKFVPYLQTAGKTYSTDGREPGELLANKRKGDIRCTRQARNVIADKA